MAALRGKSRQLGPTLLGATTVAPVLGLAACPSCGGSVVTHRPGGLFWEFWHVPGRPGRSMWVGRLLSRGCWGVWTEGYHTM